MSNVLGEMPTFDDIADKESYKMYKWMVHKKHFTLSDINNEFKADEDDEFVTVLSAMALAKLLGIKYSRNSYYSDDELRNISFQQMSNATIETTPLLARYIEKRETENVRWHLPTALSIISLSVSILTLIISLFPKTIAVNITSWPATAETAYQSSETTYPQ